MCHSYIALLFRQPRQHFGNVEGIKSRTGEALLAEIVQRRANMNNARIVDDQKTVMKLIRGLNHERIRVLEIKLIHVNRVKQFRSSWAIHHRHTNPRPLLRDNRQNRIVELRINNDQLLLCQTNELLHLRKGIVELPIKEYLLRWEGLVLHRVENLVELIPHGELLHFHRFKPL